MILDLSLPDDTTLGISLKPPKFVRKAAKAVVHAAAVNVAVAKKDISAGAKATVKALTPGRDIRRAAALIMAPIIPPLAPMLLSEGDKKALVKAVKVNTANVVKSAKKVSMNKIVDAFTPDVILPEEESGFKKMLPMLAAGGAGLLLLL